MELCIRRLACLACLLGVLVMTTTTSAQVKKTKCCTEISVTNITAPIIGYRVQRKNLPCVRAVIFKTTEGEVCSHWKQEWVFAKIMELEQIRNQNKTTPATTTSST